MEGGGGLRAYIGWDDSAEVSVLVEDLIEGITDSKQGRLVSSKMASGRQWAFYVFILMNATVLLSTSAQFVIDRYDSKILGGDCNPPADCKDVPNSECNNEKVCVCIADYNDDGNGKCIP
ncbi:hypothetical protein J437_LFUL007563, partial [Ladona fulva]